jgi:alpha-ribazole phosphatase
LCYGQTDCLPDEDTFSASIDSASAALKGLLKGQAAQWYSSPLLRCANFSLALASDLSAEIPVVSARLLEMNFGSWENLAWSDIERAQLDAWAKDPWHFKPGGLESVSDLLARWRAFKQEIGLKAEAGVTVVVTHAGIIRMALLDAKIISEQDMWTYSVPYATPIDLTL